MDNTNEQRGGSRWVARYEVAVDPQQYPRVHALLQQKGAFGTDFAANLERLAQEYLVAVEQHLADTAAASASTLAAVTATAADLSAATSATAAAPAPAIDGDTVSASSGAAAKAPPKGVTEG